RLIFSRVGEEVFSTSVSEWGVRAGSGERGAGSGSGAPPSALFCAVLSGVGVGPYLRSVLSGLGCWEMGRGGLVLLCLGCGLYAARVLSGLRGARFIGPFYRSDLWGRGDGRDRL